MKNCVFGIMFCAACSMIGETCATKSKEVLNIGTPSTFNQDLKAKVKAVLCIEGMDPAEIVFFNEDGSYTDESKRTATYTVNAMTGGSDKLAVKLTKVSLDRKFTSAGVDIDKIGDAETKLNETHGVNPEFCWYHNGTNLGDGADNVERQIDGVSDGDEIKAVFDINDDERKTMRGGTYGGTARFEVRCVS